MGNLLFKERDKETKGTGGKKMQAAQPVDLTAELAEVLRWREMEWSRIPPLSRKLVMPYLGAGDTINLDTAVTNKEDRKHLVKSYVGLRSAGLDGYAHYQAEPYLVFPSSLKWIQKRSIDLRNFRLMYCGSDDQSDVLFSLVDDLEEELATFFVTRCDNAKDASFGIRNRDYNVGEYRDSIKTSTLIRASERGYLEIVQTLVGREGTDLNKANTSGDTALHVAAEKGHIEVVRTLLEAGADVRKGRFGRTPISRACHGKHVEVLRVLMEAGGDVDTPDSSGLTALHDASDCGFTEGVRYLVERGADVNMSSTSRNGDTPLTLASEADQLEVVRALLEAGADVNKRTTCPFGHTPLTSASLFGNVEVVRALLEAGADVNKRNSDGKSPLYCALMAKPSKRAQIAALLREAGAQEPTTAELEEIEELIAYIQLNMN